MEKEIKEIKKELAKQKQKIFDLETKVNQIIETIEVVHNLVEKAIKIMLKEYLELENDETMIEHSKLAQYDYDQTKWTPLKDKFK